MKRLFIVTRGSLAAKYGVGTYIRQLESCFDPEEWKVTVVEVFSLVKDFTEAEEAGITYYQIPLKSNSGNTISEEFTRNYYRSVFYFLKAQTIPGDSIFCHFNFVYEYELALLFKTKLDARIVLTLHYMDWSFDLLGDRGWLQRILEHPENEKDRWVIKRLEAERNFMQACCDKVIAIARHSYDTLSALYGIPVSKLVYIPNALQDEYIKRTDWERRQLRKKYRFHEHEKLVLFAGRFNLVKGIKELIEAFKLVLDDLPECRLILAGSEGILSCFEVAVPDWSRIVFTGFVSKEQLYELYSIADVGIVPSLHEEFGYVAVEMMMNDLPLIVSNTTGLKEVTADGKFALLIDLSEEEKRVSRIREGILQWFKGVGSLGSGRERFKSEYDLKIFEYKIKQLYQDLSNL